MDIINQNIKLALVVIVIIGSNFVYKMMKPEKKIVDLKKQIIYNDSYENQEKSSENKNYGNYEDKKVDVNLAQLDDLIKYGLSGTISNKIIIYREMVGKITNVKEISRIEGIGKKSLEKILEKVEVRETASNMTMNMLDINTATKQELLYYGFSKKERKKIEKYKKENGVIYSNLEMMEILGEERYREYEDVLSY